MDDYQVPFFSGGYEIQHHERQADEISTFELVKMKWMQEKERLKANLLGPHKYSWEREREKKE